MKISARADPVVRRQRVVGRAQNSNSKQERRRSFHIPGQGTINCNLEHVSPLLKRRRELLEGLTLQKPACEITVGTSALPVGLASSIGSLQQDSVIVCAANTAQLISFDQLIAPASDVHSVIAAGAKMLSPKEDAAAHQTSISVCETGSRKVEVETRSSKDCEKMANKSSLASVLFGSLGLASGMYALIKTGATEVPAKITQIYERGLPPAMFENPVGPLGSLADLVHVNYLVLVSGVLLAMCGWAFVFREHFIGSMAFAKEKLSGVAAVLVALVEFVVVSLTNALTYAISYLKVWFAVRMDDNALKTSLLTPNKYTSAKTSQIVTKLSGGNRPNNSVDSSWLKALVVPATLAILIVALFAHARYDAFGLQASHQEKIAGFVPTDLIPEEINALPGDYATNVFTETSKPAPAPAPSPSDQVVSQAAIDLSAPLAGKTSL